MIAQHTPGPWEVLPLEGKYYGTRVRIGNRCIANLWGCGDGVASEREIAGGWEPDWGLDHVEQPTDLANARLIAAAPELLEALKWTARALDKEHPASIKARAAIAKVEGGAA